MSAYINRRKVLKNFRNIQKNNGQFVSYIDDLVIRNEQDDFSLVDADKQNLTSLKEHLNNMTILFQELSDSVTNKKQTGV